MPPFQFASNACRHVAVGAASLAMLNSEDIEAARAAVMADSGQREQATSSLRRPCALIAVAIAVIRTR